MFYKPDFQIVERVNTVAGEYDINKNINYDSQYVVMSSNDNMTCRSMLGRKFDSVLEAKKALYEYLVYSRKPLFEGQLELIKKHIEDKEKKQ